MNRFHSFILNIFLRVFCSILALSRKVHWAKTCAILFFSPLPFLQKAFQETYSWLLFFKRRSSLLNTGLKRLIAFGFIARSGFASWLITGLKRLTAFGFIARSGYNFLVVITGLKRLTVFGFIARSGHNFLVVITEHKEEDSFVVHCL
ncbi:hypothetical protein GmHk_06G017474 [Glycine max]|nr:hypothetical protein GmHk_06G017474 [Glycine max]